MTNLIRDLLYRLKVVFDELHIDYVIVGGIAVIAFARVRTTGDIDVIIDHEGLDIPQFVELLNKHGFDASLNDFINLKEKLHVNFYDKDTMFRIDLKGIYKEKDRQSIFESQIVEFEGMKLHLDSFENLIVNKLLFGSETDIEDAIATVAGNYNAIDFPLLEQKATQLGVLQELKKLMEDYDFSE